MFICKLIVFAVNFIRSNHKVLLDVGQFKSDCNLQFLWVEGLVEAICVIGQVDWTLAKFFIVFFWTETSQGLWKRQKRTISSRLHRTSLVNKGFNNGQKGNFLLLDYPARKLSVGRWTRLANQNIGFVSPCSRNGISYVIKGLIDWQLKLEEHLQGD